MEKTVFVLAGGNDLKAKDYCQCLNIELAKYIVRPKILSCFFSAPQEKWERYYQTWKAWFSGLLTQEFVYSCAEYGSLLEQIDVADVVYFHGGNTLLLLDALPNTTELQECLKGKVVIGSSAGANMLSRYFWSSTRGVFGEGRGILDLNIMVHYGARDTSGKIRTMEDWRREESEFQERIGNLAITRLPEGQFVTIEQ